MNKKIVFTLAAVTIVYIVSFVRLPHVDIKNSTFGVSCNGDAILGFGQIIGSLVLQTSPNTGLKQDATYSFLDDKPGHDADVISKVICNTGKIPTDDSISVLKNPMEYLKISSAAPNYTIVLTDRVFSPTWTDVIGKIAALFVMLSVVWVIMTLVV